MEPWSWGRKLEKLMGLSAISLLKICRVLEKALNDTGYPNLSISIVDFPRILFLFVDI